MLLEEQSVGGTPMMDNKRRKTWNLVIIITTLNLTAAA